MKWRTAATGVVVAAAVAYSGFLVRQSVHAHKASATPTVASKGGAQEGYLPGDIAPNFSLVTTKGTKVSLASLHGHAVWLNFWATWCPHCRQELALLEKEHQQHGSQLVIVGVDMEQSRSKVQTFAAARGLTYPVALDVQGSVSAAYNVHGLPTSVFIAPDGTIKAVRAGAITSPTLAQHYLNLILKTSG